MSGRCSLPVLSVTDEIFGNALALEAPPQLGANDRVRFLVARQRREKHAATCLVTGIPWILTADNGFDDMRGLRRVYQLDERSLQQLLGN